MSENHPQYGTFQLDNATDEEKLRFALSILSLDVIHRVARLVQAVLSCGYGDVTIKIQDGKIFVITHTKSEKVG